MKSCDKILIPGFLPAVDGIRSSLGWALAISSAPLVDIGLTSTTEELMAI
ncbi:hypothetical protein ACFUTU_14540 [Arthrobacter sp. NPDC057388]